MKVIEVKKFKEVLMKIIEKRKVQELLMLIEKKIEEQNEAWRAEILQILGELTTDNTVGPEASATGSNSADTAKEVEK